MFGRYPRRDRIGESISSFVPPNVYNPTPALSSTSLPDLFDRTYDSALFGKWHLGTHSLCQANLDLGVYNPCAATPLLHGFEEASTVSMENLNAFPGHGYSYWLSADDGVFTERAVYAERARFEAFQGWWRRAPETPKFAFYSFNYAHAPFHSPPNLLVPTPISVRRRYESMIAAMDTLIGKILEEIDLENTYVIFFTDNGTPDEVDDAVPCPPGVPRCAKHTVYEAGINVPCIIAGRGIPAGSVSHSLMSCVDLMATIADLVGSTVKVGEDSISFAATLADPSSRSRRYVFSEIFEDSLEQATVVGETSKLIRSRNKEVLYDVSGGQEKPIPPNRIVPAVLSELRAVLANPLDRSLQAW
jgi:arylsulfatase A-like enzyme